VRKHELAGRQARISSGGVETRPHLLRMGCTARPFTTEESLRQPWLRTSTQEAALARVDGLVALTTETRNLGVVTCVLVTPVHADRMCAVLNHDDVVRIAHRFDLQNKRLFNHSDDLVTHVMWCAIGCDLKLNEAKLPLHDQAKVCST
jgi:hypothetical protein